MGRGWRMEQVRGWDGRVDGSRRSVGSASWEWYVKWENIALLFYKINKFKKERRNLGFRWGIKEGKTKTWHISVLVVFGEHRWILPRQVEETKSSYTRKHLERSPLQTARNFFFPFEHWKAGWLKWLSNCIITVLFFKKKFLARWIRWFFKKESKANTAKQSSEWLTDECSLASSPAFGALRLLCFPVSTANQLCNLGIFKRSGVVPKHGI